MNIKRTFIATTTCVLVLVISLSVVFASLEIVNFDYKIIKGSPSVGSMEKDSSHYYAWASFDRKYNKIDATVKIPGPEHQITQSNGRKRAAYISFGVKGNHGFDFGVTKSPVFGNKWHPYACNTSTGQFKVWQEYTFASNSNQYVNMSLETSVGSDGETDIIFKIDNITFNGDYMKDNNSKKMLYDSSFVEWRGLADKAFCRFVSLCPLGSYTKKDKMEIDGTMHRGVDFINLNIYYRKTNSSSYPYGLPVKRSWGMNDGHVARAWKVYPKNIGVHVSGKNEYININNKSKNPEV
ncbi:hypothetical protein PV797_01330 [Clostridiaceae bacterium M8S5]|nr:hypothetical protein PV797_01330 [Clostridiaceae bacterium M8S5]